MKQVYAPNVPKHYQQTSLTAMLRTIAKTRSNFFYNGTLVKVNLQALTVDFVGKNEKHEFSTLAKLAKFLRTNELALERITELYLKTFSNPCPYSLAA